MSKQFPKKFLETECPPCAADKICNTKTGRCVSKTGAIGRALATQKPASKPASDGPASDGPASTCPSGKNCAPDWCNPQTNRCVKPTGAIGKKLHALFLSVQKPPQPKPSQPKPPASNGPSSTCPSGKNCAPDWCNPQTNRCVKPTGAIGKKMHALFHLSKKPKNSRRAFTRSDAKVIRQWVHDSYDIGFVSKLATWYQRAYKTDEIWNAFLAARGKTVSVQKPIPKTLNPEFQMREGQPYTVPNVDITRAQFNDVLDQLMTLYLHLKSGLAYRQNWKDIRAERNVKNVNLAPPAHHVKDMSVRKQLKRLERAASPNKQPVKAMACNTLVTVPQSPGRGTCWFNATLMVHLFSDGMRAVSKSAIAALLRRPRELSAKELDVLQRIASLLLIYKQPQTKISQIYKKAFQYGIRPEDLLRSLYRMDPGFLGHSITGASPKNIVKGERGFTIESAAFLCVKLLGIRAKVFETRTTVSNDVYILDVTSLVPGPKYGMDIPSLNGSSPDVVLLMRNTWDYDDIYDIAQRQITQKQLPKLSSPVPETMRVHGETFVLDSTLMSSKTVSADGKQQGHAICGVTCNGKRMYYNGWTQSGSTATPCALIPVDWSKKPIYLSTGQKRETRNGSGCYATTKPAAADTSRFFAFNGSDPAQVQILFYVKLQDRF